MEDEVHQICPIAWWHVWDNLPYPAYNKEIYETTDLINCHSYLTYQMCHERFPEKTNFIPHSIPQNIFFPIPESQKMQFRDQILGNSRRDHFVGIWVNRNAKRKRPSDVIESWKIFLDNLEEKHGHRNATLIMHTDPLDQEGPNLFLVTEHFGVQESVFFSKDRLDFDKMNILYNISDFCINISYAEGFGLSTLESMQAGVPIVAVKTGGLSRQVVDHRDESENGISLDVEMRTLVGSQQVPYIYEDYVSCDTVASGIMRLYELPKKDKEKLSQKVRDYVLSEFAYQDTVDSWHETMKDLSNNWKDQYKSWELITI
jgi:glycosyltransferase involved in cell wall biosynthesis